MVHIARRPNLSPALLDDPGTSRLVTTLEVLTVVACLVLGVAFMGSMLASPPSPDATTRACPTGSATPC